VGVMPISASHVHEFVIGGGAPLHTASDAALPARFLPEQFSSSVGIKAYTMPDFCPATSTRLPFDSFCRIAERRNRVRSFRFGQLLSSLESHATFTHRSAGTAATRETSRSSDQRHKSIAGFRSWVCVVISRVT